MRQCEVLAYKFDDQHSVFMEVKPPISRSCTDPQLDLLKKLYSDEFVTDIERKRLGLILADDRMTKRGASNLISYFIGSRDVDGFMLADGVLRKRKRDKSLT